MRAAIVAFAVVLAVAGCSADQGEPEPGPLGPLDILAAVRVGDGVVRVVTEEGGCREPRFVDVRLRADAVVLRVIGRDRGGGCTAEIKERCRELRLHVGAAGKRLVPVPDVDRAGGETLARELDACPRLRVR